MVSKVVLTQPFPLMHPAMGPVKVSVVDLLDQEEVNPKVEPTMMVVIRIDKGPAHLVENIES